MQDGEAFAIKKEGRAPQRFGEHGAEIPEDGLFVAQRTSE